MLELLSNQNYLLLLWNYRIHDMFNDMKFKINKNENCLLVNFKF